MLSNEKKQTILVLYKLGCGIRKIHRLLNISRKAIRKVVNGETEKQEDRPSRYESITPFVQKHFNECKGNAVRLKEVLEEKYDKTLPYSSLTRIVRELNLRNNKKKRAGSYTFGPGREVQHDTSPHRLVVGGKQVMAQCASATMGYSKKVFIQYYPNFTRFEAKMFLTEAMKYMGGGCKRCIIDNTSVIVAHGSGPGAIIAPEMEAFGKIFGTTFTPHHIGHADRKAGVERNFRYVENNFLAARTFADWHDLNLQARWWCDEVANIKPKRSLGMKSPEEAHLIETPHLTPLPRHIPPVYKTLQRMVSIYGFVTIDTNRYSVPESLCGQHVEVLKSWDRITVFTAKGEVADHQRLIIERDKTVTAKGHHLPFQRNRRKKRPYKEEKALTGRCEGLDSYVFNLKKRCHGSGRLKLRKLLELQRTYPKDAFEKAVDRALHYRLYDLLRLESLILEFVAGDFFNLEDKD